MTETNITPPKDTTAADASKPEEKAASVAATVKQEITTEVATAVDAKTDNESRPVRN